MTWAWKTQLKPTLKLTLLALSDYSNDEGFCWPSIESMVKKSSLTRSSLINNVQKLCDMGVIKKQKRYENGKRSSNEYRLNIELSPESVRMESGHPESIRTESIRMEKNSASPENRPTTIYKPSVTNNRTVNNMRSNVRKRTKSANNYSDAFLKFYSDYPRHRDKPRAWQAWQKVNPEETKTNQIMDGIENFNKEIEVKQTPKKYIKYPAVWLNNLCWEDDYEIIQDQQPNRETRKSTSEQFADNLRNAMQEAGT
jgi:hypothetical protein